MNNPLDATLRELNDCGCCAGTTVETPVAIENRPGLGAIIFRAGKQPQFKATMLALLTAAGSPALKNLRTRDDDDFTIALLDGWATVADVLTFYSERITNESFLRTATERRSILELARSIGYELNPGVAASTWLAFTVEDALGAPGYANIDKGTRVQSIPGPDEKPQVFETVEPISAKQTLNKRRIYPQPQPDNPLAFGRTSGFLHPQAASAIQEELSVGDKLVLFFKEQDGTVEEKEVASLQRQKAHTELEEPLTELIWKPPIQSLTRTVENSSAFKFVRKFRLFGYNAPARYLHSYSDVGVLKWADIYSGDIKLPPIGVDYSFNLPPNTSLFLDTIYDELKVGTQVLVPVAGSKAILTTIIGISQAARNKGPLNATVTKITLKDEVPAINNLREIEVYALAGPEVSLWNSHYPEEISGNKIYIPNQQAGLGTRVPLYRLFDPTSGDHFYTVSAAERDSAMAAAGGYNDEGVAGYIFASQITGSTPLYRLFDPISGDHFYTVSAAERDSAIAAADGYNDEGVAGYLPKGLPIDVGQNLILVDQEANGQHVVVAGAETEDTDGDGIEDHLVITLTPPIDGLPTATSMFFGNVAFATHGETVKNEVLGSGDANQPHQRFVLKQAPLTYTPAANPTGGETTLEIWVNDVKWSKVSTLYDRGPRERVYVVRLADDGTITVLFGDGKNGARLPTGQENVRAVYRKGIGHEGLLKADQLSLLMTRPLGVKAVTNPKATEGAADPQVLADARNNAPTTVLTLDRVVSLQDYEDFARNFSGIAKALATWTWNVHSRGLFLTVAGVAGAVISADSSTQKDLLESLRELGNPLVPIKVKSYTSISFKVAGTVFVDADRVPEKVGTAVKNALKAAFSFDARSFGQPVTLSEVEAVIQNVAGVTFIDLDALVGTPPSKLKDYLPAQIPADGAAVASVLPAELLTLDETSLSALEVKTA